MEKEKEIKRMEFIISSTVHDCEQKDCIRNCQFVRQKDCKYFRAAKDLQAEGYGNVRAAVKDVAECIKMAFYYEFDELIPSIMADKIDELVEEVCGNEPNADRLR